MEVNFFTSKNVYFTLIFQLCIAKHGTLSWKLLYYRILKTLFYCFFASCYRSQKLVFISDLLCRSFVFLVRNLENFFSWSHCSEFLQWYAMYKSILIFHMWTLVVWQLMLSSSGKFSWVISLMVSFPFTVYSFWNLYLGIGHPGPGFYYIFLFFIIFHHFVFFALHSEIFFIICFQLCFYFTDAVSQSFFFFFEAINDSFCWDIIDILHYISFKCAAWLDICIYW